MRYRACVCVPARERDVPTPCRLQGAETLYLLNLVTLMANEMQDDETYFADLWPLYVLSVVLFSAGPKCHQAKDGVLSAT